MKERWNRFKNMRTPLYGADARPFVFMAYNTDDLTWLETSANLDRLTADRVGAIVLFAELYTNDDMQDPSNPQFYTYDEQARVLALIPALQAAGFAVLGYFAAPNMILFDAQIDFPQEMYDLFAFYGWNGVYFDNGDFVGYTDKDDSALARMFENVLIACGGVNTARIHHHASVEPQGRAGGVGGYEGNPGAYVQYENYRLWGETNQPPFDSFADPRWTSPQTLAVPNLINIYIPTGRGTVDKLSHQAVQVQMAKFGQGFDITTDAHPTYRRISNFEAYFYPEWKRQNAFFLSESSAPGGASHAGAIANEAVMLGWGAYPNERGVIRRITCGYSAAPTGGRLTVTIGGTTVFDVDISGVAPVTLPFERGLYGSYDQEVLVTLAAGGSGVYGNLNVLWG